MSLRPFGRLDWKVSALGFGAMRLPLTGPGNESLVDEEESIRMIRRAVDLGVNYVDTAWPYHGEKSEGIVGRALKNGYRERVKIATKLPCWLVEKPDDFDRFLDEQLRRLDTDCIDFYLFHAIWRDRWEHIRSMNMIASAEKAMADERIRYLGFSFHDQTGLFREVIDAYDNWTLAQIQYNFLNETVQAGTAGLNYAAQKGLAVVVMEPLLGGNITRPQGRIKEIWENSGKKPADVALRWIWDKPGVSTILSGMSAMQQVLENIESARKSADSSLTGEEHELIERVRTAYSGLNTIPCTKCGYCMPCPHGLDIPYNFEVFNLSRVNPDMGRALYLWHFTESAKASQCQACGICEPLCPQKIPIMENMKKINRHFGQ
ncbi:aldo/keto reductase [bacterium]|nr:aldo/keto reductase [bacterium]